LKLEELEELEDMINPEHSDEGQLHDAKSAEIKKAFSLP